MKLRYFALVLTILLFAGSAASLDYTHEEKMYYGDTLELQEYEIRYDDRNQETSFTVGKWTGTSFLILEEIEGTELYNSEGEKLNISEDLNIVIEQTGYDEDGRYLNLSISSNEDIFSSGEISTTAPDKIIISQGESSQIPLTLSNTGFLDQDYNLSYESEAPFDVSFEFQNFNVTRAFVEAGEDASVTATVEVPETAELGTYDLTLKASNNTDLSETFRIEVRGREIERDMNLDLDERYTQARSGETIEIPFTIRGSSGYGYIGPRDSREAPSLENVTFNIEAPEGWDYEVTPERIDTLEPRMRRSVRVSVDVPANADTGDYFVDISASSNQASIEEPERMRVNIQETNRMGYVGGVLMALSLGLLVLVYRKFGRR